MTEKTTKALVITAGSALCLALAVGITLRFGGHAEVPTGNTPSASVEESKEPIVNIQDTDIQDTQTPESTLPVVEIQTPESSEPSSGDGAVSSGTQQTIQADPVKPHAPDKPTATGTTPLPDDHSGEDVPEEERNTEEHPTYEKEQTTVTTKPDDTPKMGDTNAAGQIYVEGFGWVTPSGPNDGGTLDDMYENGNKIGIMD